MSSTCEALQSAFLKASHGECDLLRSLLEQGIGPEDLYPLLSIVSHQELGQNIELQQLFVHKKPYEIVDFGDSDPEIAAPLAFLIALHEQGRVDAGHLLCKMVFHPDLAIQIAMLPASWCRQSASCLDPLILRQPQQILSAMVEKDLPLGDYMARLLTEHQLGQILSSPEFSSLRLSGASRRLLGREPEGSSGSGARAVNDGLLGGFGNDGSLDGNQMFLGASTKGVISSTFAAEMLQKGLNLGLMPYPLSQLVDIESYYQLSCHHAHLTTPDHMTWIEFTFLNALTCCFVGGNDDAARVLSEAKLSNGFRQALINDWANRRPEILEQIPSSQLDANLGIDLGL